MESIVVGISVMCPYQLRVLLGDFGKGGVQCVLQLATWAVTCEIPSLHAQLFPLIERQEDVEVGARDFIARTQVPGCEHEECFANTDWGGAWKARVVHERGQPPQPPVVYLQVGHICLIRRQPCKYKDAFPVHRLGIEFNPERKVLRMTHTDLPVLLPRARQILPPHGGITINCVELNDTAEACSIQMLLSCRV